MSIKPSRSPYGYRELLVYKKADELQSTCAKLTECFLNFKTLIALADQMNRSARSTKQNITEGWKRNSTKEYYEFLGYALASNAELEEDCTDIWKGHYRELTGLKGVMGERGGRGYEDSAHSDPVSPVHPVSLFDIEQLPFYPLDLSLPPVVQLKLRAKELNYLLEKLQKSLVNKMSEDQTLPVSERLKLSQQREKDFDHWLEEQKRNGSKGSNGRNDNPAL